jgi:hypothetical protein
MGTFRINAKTDPKMNGEVTPDIIPYTAFTRSVSFKSQYNKMQAIAPNKM